MAVLVEFDLDIQQIDIITAYLNGHLEKEVIMEVPEMLREMPVKINSSRRKREWS